MAYLLEFAPAASALFSAAAAGISAWNASKTFRNADIQYQHSYYDAVTEWLSDTLVLMHEAQNVRAADYDGELRQVARSLRMQFEKGVMLFGRPELGENGYKHPEPLAIVLECQQFLMDLIDSKIKQPSIIKNHLQLRNFAENLTTVVTEAFDVKARLARATRKTLIFRDVNWKLTDDKSSTR